MGQVPCMVRVEVEKTQRLQFQVRYGPCTCLPRMVWHTVLLAYLPVLRVKLSCMWMWAGYR